MSLLRTKQSKKKARIEDEIADTDDNVVYSSVNDRHGTTFKAASPANSRHAARLAKLAVAVQQDQPSRNSNKSRFVAALPSTAGPRNQIEYPAEQRDPRPRQPLQPAPAVRHAPVTENPAQQQYAHQPVQTYVARDGREYLAHPEPAPGPYLPAAPVYEAGRNQYQQGGGYTSAGYQTVEYRSEIPAAQYVGVANSQAAVAAPVARASWAPVATRQQAEPLPDVTRYRTEQKTAYKVKSGSGRLRVSAPVGSSEAELFDAIAAANSRPPDADDRYEQSVVKSSSKGGWWKRTS